MCEVLTMSDVLKNLLVWLERAYTKNTSNAENLECLLPPNYTLTGSKKQFAEELITLMPFVTNIDKKMLQACLQYYEHKDSKEEDVFLKKNPSYQMGKWLVTTLYYNKNADVEAIGRVLKKNAGV